MTQIFLRLKCAILNKVNADKSLRFHLPLNKSWSLWLSDPGTHTGLCHVSQLPPCWTGIISFSQRSPGVKGGWGTKQPVRDLQSLSKKQEALWAPRVVEEKVPRSTAASEQDRWDLKGGKGKKGVKNIYLYIYIWLFHPRGPGFGVVDWCSAAWQDGIRNMPLDILHLCWVLQVLREGGVALAVTEQSGRLLGLWHTRRVEVRTGQMWWVGLRRHGHGVVRGHGEVDPAGKGVLGFVVEVRVWALKKGLTGKKRQSNEFWTTPVIQFSNFSSSLW